MLTASHLPFNRNGMKFFTAKGGLDKPDIKMILDEAIAACTEAGVDPCKLFNHVQLRIVCVLLWSKRSNSQRNQLHTCPVPKISLLGQPYSEDNLIHRILNTLTAFVFCTCLKIVV